MYYLRYLISPQRRRSSFYLSATISLAVFITITIIMIKTVMIILIMITIIAKIKMGI